MVDIEHALEIITGGASFAVGVVRVVLFSSWWC